MMSLNIKLFLSSDEYTTKYFANKTIKFNLFEVDDFQTYQTERAYRVVLKYINYTKQTKISIESQRHIFRNIANIIHPKKGSCINQEKNIISESPATYILAVISNTTYK